MHYLLISSAFCYHAGMPVQSHANKLLRLAAKQPAVSARELSDRLTVLFGQLQRSSANTVMDTVVWVRSTMNDDEPL